MTGVLGYTEHKVVTTDLCGELVRQSVGLLEPMP
jgi:hypothetical protein